MEGMGRRRSFNDCKYETSYPRVRTALISRPRLMRKLDEGMIAKLMLVSAQADYGKTAALSEWVKQCSAIVALVSLDNDWIQF